MSTRLHPSWGRAHFTMFTPPSSSFFQKGIFDNVRFYGSVVSPKQPSNYLTAHQHNIGYSVPNQVSNHWKTLKSKRDFKKRKGNGSENCFPQKYVRQSWNFTASRPWHNRCWFQLDFYAIKMKRTNCWRNKADCNTLNLCMQRLSARQW